MPKLCECGCGEPAPIARITNRKWGHVKGQPMRFVLGHSTKGRRLPTRMMRKAMGRAGYMGRVDDSHPRRDKRTGRVYEHILVAEAAMGKFLPPGAVVHHVDSNPSNNLPSNLVVCQDQGYHMLLHRRQRAYLACGNPRAERCQICRAYDRQESIVIRHSNAGRHRSYHIECERAAYRRQRLARQARNREAAQQSAD